MTWTASAHQPAAVRMSEPEPVAAAPVATEGAGQEGGEDHSLSPDEAQAKRNEDKPRCFLEVSIGGAALPAPVVIELYWDTYPHTCDAFLRLCKGTTMSEGGAASSAAAAAAASSADKEAADSSTVHTYKGTKLSKVIANFLVQGGNVTAAVPGIVDVMDEQLTEVAAFRAKRFGSSNNFNKPFQIALCNKGVPNSNSAEFFINTVSAPHLNGRFCVFGHVVEGQATVKAIEATKTDMEMVPLQSVVIQACGEVIPPPPPPPPPPPVPKEGEN